MQEKKRKIKKIITTDELKKKLIEEKINRVPIKIIAKKYKLTIDSLHKFFSVNKIRKPSKIEGQYEQIVDMFYNQKLTYNQIKDKLKLNIDSNYFYDILKRHNKSRKYLRIDKKIYKELYKKFIELKKQKKTLKNISEILNISLTKTIYFNKKYLKAKKEFKRDKITDTFLKINNLENKKEKEIEINHWKMLI